MNKIVKGLLIVLALTVGVSCATSKQAPSSMENKKSIVTDNLEGINRVMFDTHLKKLELGEEANKRIKSKLSECTNNVIRKTMPQFFDEKYLTTLKNIIDVQNALDDEARRTGNDSGYMIARCVDSTIREEIEKKQNRI